MRPANAALRATVSTVVRAWLRPVVTGRDHVPTTGPCLLAATHASHADNVLLGTQLGRSVHFLGSSSLQSTPVVGPLLTALGMVPVLRGTADVDALRTIEALLDDGAAVVVYPEGSRSRDGRVHRPRSGIARLSAATGIPVVPVGVSGTSRAWPVDARPTVRGATVRVSVGEPLPAPAASPAARRAFQSELHDRLVALSGRSRADGFAPVATEVA